MTRLLLYLLLQALLLAGIGRLMQQWWWKKRALGLADTTWLGLAGVITLLQLWHLLLPISGYSSLLLATIGLCGLPLLWKDGDLRQHPRRSLLFYTALLLALTAIILSLTAVRHISAGDTLLYHLNAVRWNNEYALVPGLANLHQRFGVNSTWLLYAAALDTGWADGRSAWLISALPLLLALAQWLAVLFLPSQQRHWPSVIYCIVTLPYLLELIEAAQPSLYYDKPPLLLLLVLGLHALRTPWLQRSAGAEASFIPSATWLLTAAALAFSLKASCALALVLVTAFILTHWFTRTARSYRTLLSIWWLPSLLVLLYMVSNAVTSGWPLFPMPVLGLPTDWAQPVEDVKAFNRIILDWAKVPGVDSTSTVAQGFWAWWRVWLPGFYRSPQYSAVILSAVSTVLTLWALSQKPASKTSPWHPTAVLGLHLLPISSVIFWLFTAPDLRFGDGLFYLWLGITLTTTLTLLLQKPALQLICAAAVSLLTLLELQPRILPRSPFYLSKVYPAEPAPVELKPAQHPEGPSLWLPKDPAIGQLGDSPLPATPYTDPRLRWRKQQSLAHGFRLQPAEPKQ